MIKTMIENNIIWKVLRQARIHQTKDTNENAKEEKGDLRFQNHQKQEKKKILNLDPKKYPILSYQKYN